MTLDETIKVLESIHLGKSLHTKEACEQAVDIIRKYIKIKDIITRIPYGGDCTVYKIGEVINGNDD